MSDFKKAVWTTQWRGGIQFYHRSPEEAQKRVSQLADAGFSMIIPNLDRPKGVLFFTDATEVNSEYPEWDPLKVLIEKASEVGIKVHAWLCCFKSGANQAMFRKYPKAVAQFVNAPAWKSERMNQGTWACAMQPKVQEYMLNLYRSIAERYRPAGLHLDYIRTGSQCLCDYCAAEMVKQGIDIRALQKKYDNNRDLWLSTATRGILRKYAAQGVKVSDIFQFLNIEKGEQVDAELDRWIEWRVSRLTDFVREMRKLTKKYSMEISVAVKHFWPCQTPTGGQDWVRWVKEELLDYLMPMIYTNDVSLVERIISLHLELIKGSSCEYWAGLGKQSTCSSLTHEQLGEQLQIARDAGTKGVTIFSESALQDADLQVLKKF